MPFPGVRGVSAAIAIVVAAGCSPQDAPRRDVKGGDGVLRLSLPGEPRTLNPDLGPLDEYALLVTQNIFSKLVTRAADGSVLPDVADRWSESPDGLLYTFHLRTDVRFHDNVPLTSEDVRSTFARIGESSNTEFAQHLAGVEAPDASTLVVRLKTPWAAFIPSIAWFGAAILPTHVYGRSAWKDSAANAAPIGSGPFKLKTWERGRRIVLEKNTAFYGQGPYVDELEYLITPVAADGVQLLRDGRVDVLMGRPPAQTIRELAGTPGLRVSMAPSDNRTYLAFNLRRAPFADARLRRAVNLALDRRRLVDTGVSGIGTPAMGFYTPAVAWAYNESARIPACDPAEAKRLVAAIAPPPLTFVYSGASDAQPTPLNAEIIRQLEAVGLRISARPIAPAAFLGYLYAGVGFDMVVLSGSHGPDPDAMTARFGSAGSMQVMGYANPAFDRELTRGGSVADPGARAAAYYRAQEILAQDLPIAPLFETIRTTVYRDGVRGLPDEDATGLVADYAFNLVRLPKK